MCNSKIIVALDIEEEAALYALIDNLSPKMCRLKIGKTLFTRYGPQWVKALQAKGFDIFLDLKFHDIPQQIYGACREAALLGVWMLNVHAFGGKAMLHAAKAAVDEVERQHGVRPLLIGVTLLTSLQQADLADIGVHYSVEETVMQLAKLCFEAQLDGVVCSAQEAPIIKKHFGPTFLCVTPGIRLLEEKQQDQKRVMTPVAAKQAGSDYLVMGRSITQAVFPIEVLKKINLSLQTV